jgi:hypothetical protein
LIRHDSVRGRNAYAHEKLSQAGSIKEFHMPGKIIAALVAAAALLGPIASASAQTQEFPRYWGGGFAGFYGYGGYYGTAYPLGDAIGVYNYAPGPGVYVYVPAYPYNGWNRW